MITPAISVLSAVEGLTTVQAGFAPYVMPIAIGILVGLFAIQARGTARVGAAVRPDHAVLFRRPSRCSASSTSSTRPSDHPRDDQSAERGRFLPRPTAARLPRHGLGRAGGDRRRGALRRHGPFRAQADRRLLAVLRHARPDAQLYGAGRDAPVAGPGRGASRRVKNPFFFLAPETLRLPLVILATLATIIASQAVISGAFSVTQQAIQLGFIPRLRIPTPAKRPPGQIYIPVINWALMVMVILLVLFFQHLVEPRRRLWHRRHRRDVHRHLPARRRPVLAVEVEAVAGDAAARHLLPGRHRLFRRQPASRCPTAAGSRCWSASIAFTLLTTWAQGPQADDRADERGGHADRDLHQVGRHQRRPASPAPRCS